MKSLRIALPLLMAAGLFSLQGCQHQSSSQVQPATQQQSYQGVLPCADCNGLQTSLFLNQDGTFVLQETYLATRDGDQVFTSYGQWLRSADKITLTTNSGDKRHFRSEGNGLRMLDRNGEAIRSELNYLLLPVSAALPTALVPLTGLYTYMADAAIFEDCATGKIFPVANTAELEQAYLAARREPGDAVFLTINGFFQVRPSMEAGRVQTVLVPERNGKFRFDRNRSCPKK
nr:envelope stress response activation lipoprotein NlpE [Serratia microhaemolytica]